MINFALKRVDFIRKLPLWGAVIYVLHISNQLVFDKDVVLKVSWYQSKFNIRQLTRH